MADHTKVVVYVPARDSRELRKDGYDPADWVRKVVKYALERQREARREGPGA